MNKIYFALLVAIPVVALALFQPSQAAHSGDDARIARGSYIANSFGCADCHTPKKFGPNGPELDNTRAFSGHPADFVMPPPPVMPEGPWNLAVAGTLTAWSGPWGVSFPANLTPDPETGLGKWTEETFVSTIRSGRHMGRGREILPPMPIEQIRNMTDEDLRAIFAYLHSLPAVKNKVPDPIAPAAAR